MVVEVAGIFDVDAVVSGEGFQEPAEDDSADGFALDRVFGGIEDRLGVGWSLCVFILIVRFLFLIFVRFGDCLFRDGSLGSIIQTSGFYGFAFTPAFGRVEPGSRSGFWFG